MRKGSAPVCGPVVEAIIELHKREQGENLVGLVFYGSHLNRTAGEQSDHDFFCIVESYPRAHPGRLDAVINKILPPSIYRRTIAMPGGPEARCKVSFVSTRDLERATLSGAADCYLFGRLGKRVSLVYARDGVARSLIEEAICRSAELCASWTLRGMEGPFSADAFILAALGLSYRCEERVEKGGTRAKSLFDADRKYFEAVYGAILSEACNRGIVRERNGDTPYQVVGTHPARHAERQAYDRFVRASRRRARLRWIKHIWTFENWADYMIVKIARHQGISIVLSPRERKHPLLAGLKYYLRLRREGRVR